MRLPVISGLIRRRLLVNFRVDADVLRRYLPAPFRPKLQAGYGIAGICLIRLEQVRPAGLPALVGIVSENAAHRVAVQWNDPAGQECEGVYIPRRDTSSWLNHLAGGRVFLGEHSLAHFDVTDDGAQVALTVRARDGGMSIQLEARATDDWPASSCFASLAESSAFFEAGSLGYSETQAGRRLDGIRLQTEGWSVQPLAVHRVESSFFADTQRFPTGSVTFDHVLVMRNLQHAWHGAPDMHREAVLA